MTQEASSTLPTGEADPPLRVDLGRGEEPILVLRPHWIFILLDRPAVLAASLILAGVGLRWAGGMLAAVLLAAPVLWLGWQLLERASRRYVLTSHRVVMVAGVLRQAVVDAPLANVRQVSVFRTIPERVLGLGTLAFATAGTGGQDLRWRVLADARDHMRTARAAMDRLDAAAQGPGR